MTDVIWGTTKKPVSSERLAKLIQNNFPEVGSLYIGYPVLSGADGFNSIDALWISPLHGIVVFHLVEGRDTGGFEEVQDDFANNFGDTLPPSPILDEGTGSIGGSYCCNLCAIFITAPTGS